MKKIFNIYKAFFKAGVQSAMAYRVSFICFFVGDSLYCIVMYFIWKAVFMSSGSGNFMGFNMADMTVYVFLSNLVGFLTSTDSTKSLANEIKDGSIIMRMIKPVNVDISLLAYEIGNKVMVFTCLFLPIMIGVEIYRYVVFGYIVFSLLNFILFAFSIVLSYLLAFYINLLFGYLAFFLMNIWGFDMLKTMLIRFFSGAIIPLAFFPDKIRFVFEQLPFASLIYTPTMVYMGKYSNYELVFVFIKQIFWLFLFVFICRMVWSVAQKRLSSQGG